MKMKIKSILFGVAVGDALGIPVEFQTRRSLKKTPVKRMFGYGTHDQPPGTWSDDSSMTFCLAESLTQDFSLNSLKENFIKWYRQNFWTAHDHVFDIGFSTAQAIIRMERGIKPEQAGAEDEQSNGNGSLMRILPLIFYIQEKDIQERFELTQKVSSLTHRHIRSILACFYYLEFARQLLLRKDKFEAYEVLQTEFPLFIQEQNIEVHELLYFNRLLQEDIWKNREEEILSTGYVLHTLEASIWCLLTTDSYKEAVLKAVNLGDDTDTTAAVTGGLAGLLYGFNKIPKSWVTQIARKEDIEDLAERMTNFLTY